MGMVKVDPEILNVLAGHISDIEHHTEATVADTRTAAGRVHAHIADEVSRRRRRVEELRDQYEACCRREGADCSDLWRLLRSAEHALDVGIRALTIITEAISEHGVQSYAVVQQMGMFCAAGKQTLTKLQKNLDDYSAFSSLVPSSVLGAAYAASPAASGPGSQDGTRLVATGQTYQSVMARGRELQVFDHPQQSAHSAVFGQGSANPTTFEGTCGLCAVGTVLNLAGKRTDEGRVTGYAVTNGLCSTNEANPGFNGGTTSAQLVSILKGYGGVSARSYNGVPLNELATAIEQGRGVIIGIDPTLINEDWYGEYNPNASQGHWVVLQSVVRDASTNEIVGYYVFDSNGRSAAETCQFLTVSQLQTAYTIDGSLAVATDGIIW